MEDIQFFNSTIIYTRVAVLTLSVCIVVISLVKYNFSTCPILSLFDNVKSHQFIYDMIEDRNLIATLIAAQASIFCPLFLLMSSPVSTYYEYSTRISFSTADICRIMIEHLCQFLMPFGLSMSWLFCITFDKRTKSALLTMIDQDLISSTLDEHNYYNTYVTLMTFALKYIIILVLLIEVVAVSCSFIKHTSFLFMAKQQSTIHLTYNHEKEEVIKDNDFTGYENEQDIEGQILFV
ncbi:uncharacterized protein BX663DRAFT_514325 [Cokeromyces recurvatus]|uniref:uncharacterized protein n=1 Tax=Cokeromyces recurvatus TaxID=90255 RepID=UPI00221E7632|nr:uncharacterized protein BX663DRAFT_514325 [Cokeromyces recurvatus]KAI7901407.1 hypothetical protein BX663DRAFT_514325 [Cokeromyces recurvatus]